MGQVDIPAIGERVRAERMRRGMSARGLARDAGVSASLISQIETGRIRPSVSTLYAVTGALGLSVTDLLEGPDPAATEESATDGAAAADDGSPDAPAGVVSTAALATLLAANPVTDQGISPAGTGRTVTGDRRDRMVGPVTVPDDREFISLDSGVTWELLGQVPGEKTDFLRNTYQPGGSSSGTGDLMRHPGTEYGYLLSGELMLQLGFDEHHLVAGDSVCFRSSTPHRYRNDGDVPAVGIWVVIDEI